MDIVNSNSRLILADKPCLKNCTTVTVKSSDSEFLNLGYNNGEIFWLIFQTYILFICLYILSKYTLAKLSTLQFISELAIVNLTVFLLSPIIILVSSVLFIIRLFVKQYLHTVYKGKVQLVSNSDSFWACDSYINTNYVYAQAIVEGELTTSEFEAKMHNVLQSDGFTHNNFERMKCKITKKFGFFCWQLDDHFDIKNHVREISQNPMNEKEALEQISHSYDEPMADCRPKWEAQFIPNFRYEKSNDTKKYYSFIWKINHVYMDGISITNSLVWYIADKPVKMAVDVFKPLNISWYQWICIYIKLALVGPHSFVKSILVKEKHCFHGPKLTGPKTLTVTRPINLNALKVIKQVKGTSITALLIAIVGGAVRRLAIRKGLPVPQKIHAGVTSAMIPYDGLRPTNRFTIAHMPISIGSSDLSKRLQSAIKSAFDLSRSVEFLLNFHVIRYIGLFPAGIIKWFIDETHCSLIFSNVPGPKEKLVFNGCPVKDMISWNVIKGSTGLGICLISYGGRIRAGIIGDAAVFKDVSDMESFTEEYENEILELALICGIPQADVFADNNTTT